MHARLDRGRVRIITRRGNDWTDKYSAIANAIAGLPAHNAYLDGELCGVLPDGRTSFNLIHNATVTGEGSLVFFLFDILHLDGENLMALPKGPIGISAEGCARLTAIQRPPDRPWPGLPSVSLRARCRGHRIEARQWSV